MNQLRVVAALCCGVCAVVLACANGAQAAPASGTAKSAGPKSNTSPKAKLLGKHMLSLQWILFDNDPYGTAIVCEKNGVMSIHGEQKGKHGNYLKIDGVVSDVKATSFVFDGEITTKVHHINDGAPCAREVKGVTFAAKGNRKYWRMQDWKNPCSEVTDYVDVYFR